jgi:Heavy-metal resistance
MISSRLLLTGLLMAALAGTAAAQRGGGGGRSGGGMDIPNVGPARMNRMDFFSQVLALKKDQKKEVRSIMDAGEKEAAPLRDQLSKSREEVAAAIEAGKSQAEIGQAVRNCADVESKMTGVELKAFAQVYKLLDSDQRSKTRPVFMMMSGIFGGKNWTEIPSE